MRRLFLAALVVLTILSFPAFQTPDAIGAETVRLPVVRDLWISSVSGEEEASNGGVPRLKVKGYQEFSILDFDVEALRGKKIRRATLAVKLASDVPLRRVSVGTISEEWREGNGANYDKTPGASSFRWRVNPNEPWLQPCALNPLEDDAYRDITGVTLGLGGSFWSSAETSEPKDGWQFVDVAPEVVAARALGVSYGFVLFDDAGSELERKPDNSVEFRPFPNRFVYSREQNRASEPYLEVEYDAPSASERAASPASPEGLAVETDDLPQGGALIRWTQPAQANARLVAFDVSIDGQPVPRSLVPAPIQDDNEIQTEPRRFETLLGGLDPTTEHTLEIRALNSLGVQSEPTTLRFRSQSRRYATWNELVDAQTEADATKNHSNNQPSATLGESQIAILDPFVKLAESGDFIVDNLPKEYWNENAIWNAATKEINLATARNEFIGFQIAFKGAAKSVRVKLQWNNEKAAPICRFHRFARVESPIGAVVDPVIEIADLSKEINLTAPNDSLYCEIFTPKDSSAGKRNGVLEIIDDENNTFRAKIELNVWKFEIPNELSFLPEMNCYSLPENERDYYRMAQLHRTFIDRVPYSHRGTVGDGLAPEWNAAKGKFDWTKWERRFGDYFTGKAFADLPRGAVPIEAFYLPIFENFPANIFEGLQDGGDAWATRSSFSKEYVDTLTSGARQFAEKIIDEEWSQTRFLFFLNNKSDYKRNGWLNASSPWLLDEPASSRDFTALAFYGKIFREATASAMTAKKANADDYNILYRADISRPQWERGFLDDSLGLYVVAGSAYKQYQKTASDRVRRLGRTLFLYGVTSAPHEDCAQPILWCFDAWTQGADGIVPWQTIGNEDSWRKSDELALFYPAVAESDGQVVPSIRLKAYRRGEQDVEYLTLLARLLNRGRNEVGLAARARLNLDKSVHLKASGEDAGKNAYRAANLDELELFRREIGKKINEFYSD